MTTPRLIIFDADGTLRRCTVPGQPCPNEPGQWELLPDVQRTIRDKAPERVAIASNQGGIALKHVMYEVAVFLLQELGATAFPEPLARTCRIYVCPHAPNAGCSCRKPSPFMLLQACIDADVVRHEALYVGDMDSDRQAAERAGIAFQWAHEFFGWPAPPAVERPEQPATGGLWRVRGRAC